MTATLVDAIVKVVAAVSWPRWPPLFVGVLRINFCLGHDEGEVSAVSGISLRFAYYLRYPETCLYQPAEYSSNTQDQQSECFY